MTEKQYGLILSSKSKAKAETQPKRNIFDDDSDDDAVPEWMKSKASEKKTVTAKSIQQKQAQKVIKQALKDDPSVYEYDEVYDKMVQEKAESKIVKNANKSSKYIEHLVKAADRRKLENEERMERKVQKEREEEGDQFQDKEEFVTGAYRKKMEELQLAREEIQRKDHIDELTDVTKQKDLSGFYRHLYREANPETSKIVEPKVEDKKSSKPPPDSTPSPAHQSEHRSVSPTQVSLGKKRSPSPPHRHIKHRSKERSRSRSRDRHHRRSHKEKHRRTEHRQHRSRSRDKRRDRERDRSNDRHVDRNTNQRYFSRRNEDERGNKRRSRDRDREYKYEKKADGGSSSVLPQRTETESTKLSSSIKSQPKEKEEEEEIEKKPSIWTKRTVGSVFDDAVERYLRRSAANSSRPVMVVED